MSLIRTLISTILFVSLLFSNFSVAEHAASSGKYTMTITIESDRVHWDQLNGYAYNDRKDETIKIWIEDISGVPNDSESAPHPIDIYILSYAELSDHICYSRWSDEDLNPHYTKETLAPSAAPFYFEFIVPDNDDYFLVIDNCDNQRDSDYKTNIEDIYVTYSIESSGSNGLGDLFFGFLCITIIIVVFVIGSFRGIIGITNRKSNQPPPYLSDNIANSSEDEIVWACEGCGVEFNTRQMVEEHENNCSYYQMDKWRRG